MGRDWDVHLDGSGLYAWVCDSIGEQPQDINNNQFSARETSLFDMACFCKELPIAEGSDTGSGPILPGAKSTYGPMGPIWGPCIPCAQGPMGPIECIESIDWLGPRALNRIRSPASLTGNSPWRPYHVSEAMICGARHASPKMYRAAFKTCRFYNMWIVNDFREWVANAFKICGGQCF
jgi:hypothetical protein